MKKEAMEYEAPRIEVIEVEVEKGFAISNGSEGEIEGMPNIEWK